jgi:hypothetical protein
MSYEIVRLHALDYLAQTLPEGQRQRVSILDFPALNKSICPSCACSGCAMFGCLLRWKSYLDHMAWGTRGISVASWIIINTAAQFIGTWSVHWGRHSQKTFAPQLAAYPGSSTATRPRLWESTSYIWLFNDPRVLSWSPYYYNPKNIRIPFTFRSPQLGPREHYDVLERGEQNDILLTWGPQTT